MPPPGSLEQTRVVLVVPAFHSLGDGIADLLLSIVLQLLSLFDHLPHDKHVLHVVQKSFCLHVHSGGVVDVGYNLHHCLRDGWSNFWFGLHPKTQHMLGGS